MSIKKYEPEKCGWAFLDPDKIGAERVKICNLLDLHEGPHCYVPFEPAAAAVNIGVGVGDSVEIKESLG